MDDKLSIPKRNKKDLVLPLIIMGLGFNEYGINKNIMRRDINIKNNEWERILRLLKNFIFFLLFNFLAFFRKIIE